jgi:hypothetical protein
MPILLRLVLLALAGIWLVGARHASQRSGQPLNNAGIGLPQPTAAVQVASQRW